MYTACTQCYKEVYKTPSMRNKSNNLFCSQSCAATYNNHKYPKRQKESACIICDKPCQRSRKKCKQCIDTLYIPLDNLKIEEIPLKYQGGRRAAGWVNSKIRERARRVYKDLTRLPCNNCGYSNFVEICHIRSISSFPKDTLVSTVNSKNNIIQLCRNCHWELDNGRPVRTCTETNP